GLHRRAGTAPAIVSNALPVRRDHLRRARAGRTGDGAESTRRGGARWRRGTRIPVANQLNQDMTHLQGQRLEGRLAPVVGLVTARARSGGGPQVPRKPVRLPPRPVVLAGREGLLADLDTQLAGEGDQRPQMVALWGLGGAGKTSVAVEYAHRHLAEVGV